MDKKKSKLNISVSIAFRLITLVMSIVTQRLLIQFCGNEVNGLNALYISIVGFLAVAELGIGSAITFCMYKPIVEGNQEQVSALYFLFRRLYRLVGLVILVAGLGLTPFIHHFAKDYEQVDVNMQGTFVLMLISTVLTYLFSAKTSLINAYKNNYITTSIRSGGLILQCVLQMISLVITQSFEWYLVCRIVAVCAQWAITELITREKYYPIVSNKQKLNASGQAEVVKSAKAMFIHKIGGLLVNTADSIVISIFLGVTVLGLYSNYVTVLNAMTGTIILVFYSLTSVIGHLFAKEGSRSTRRYFEAFHLLNFLLGIVFYLGYYAIVDNLVTVFFGEGLTVARELTFVVSFNGFVAFLRQSGLTFRDATGTFYNDRWKPVFEGFLNVILSVVFIRWMGVTGVIVATIITNLLICHIVEPYVLYRHAFDASPKRHYIRNYAMIAIFAAALLMLHFTMVTMDNQWLELLANGCISVGISGIVCLLTMLRYKDLLSLLLGMRGKKTNLSY